MKKRLVLLMVFFASLAVTTASFSLDETQDTAFAYGTVFAIDLSGGTANTITIREQNYDNDVETEVTYYLTPETAFENIASLAEIAVGNDVDISYLIKEDGKKVIKFISVYRPELEGEEE